MEGKKLESWLTWVPPSSGEPRLLADWGSSLEFGQVGYNKNTASHEVSVDA